jgi:hypothetical protein
MRIGHFFVTVCLLFAAQFVPPASANANHLSEFLRLLFSAGRREIPRPASTTIERTVGPWHAPNEIKGVPKMHVSREIPSWENIDASSEAAKEAFKKTIEKAIEEAAKAHTSHDRPDEQKRK